MLNNHLLIDNSWTLFLDRDGVINERLPGAYVSKISEFKLLPGVLEAMKDFAGLFDVIVIATNQQGIGKGLMSTSDLINVHSYMKEAILTAGGRIDQIYFCPDVAEDDPPCRKPNPGMAHQAQKDFPQIDFKKSIMVGDFITDMAFGKRVGMTTVFISEEGSNNKNIDHTFTSLKQLANSLKKEPL